MVSAGELREGVGDEWGEGVDVFGERFGDALEGFEGDGGLDLEGDSAVKDFS